MDCCTAIDQSCNDRGRHRNTATVFIVLWFPVCAGLVIAAFICIFPNWADETPCTVVNVMSTQPTTGATVYRVTTYVYVANRPEKVYDMGTTVGFNFVPDPLYKASNRSTCYTWTSKHNGDTIEYCKVGSPPTQPARDFRAGIIMFSIIGGVAVCHVLFCLFIRYEGCLKKRNQRRRRPVVVHEVSEYAYQVEGEGSGETA